MASVRVTTGDISIIQSPEISSSTHPSPQTQVLSYRTFPSRRPCIRSHQRANDYPTQNHVFFSRDVPRSFAIPSHSN